MQTRDALVAHDLTKIRTKSCGVGITTWTTTGEVMKRRDKHQRKAYAARRASRAIDRLIRAKSAQEKAQACIWANLWGVAAGYLNAK